MHVVPRIGLFGGTFDPPHLGHLAVARAALEAFHLDRLIFIPCLIAPHKSEEKPTAVEHRLRMLQLALQNEPQFEISTVELERKPPSYSCDTVKHFRASHPEAQLFWILGSDQWEVIETWRDIREMAGLVQFIVVARPEMVQPRLGIIPLRLGAQSDSSSSRVRKKLRAGLPVNDLLPSSVEQYIRQQQIYFK
ncbi:MAG: nicotinate (nicotinamide) nucleotide adenylyltransferase [bacterium]